MAKQSVKPEPASESRLKRYTDIDKMQAEEGSHPATKALHERPATRDGQAKLREYVRIERGIKA